MFSNWLKIEKVLLVRALRMDERRTNADYGYERPDMYVKSTEIAEFLVGTTEATSSIADR